MEELKPFDVYRWQYANHEEYIEKHKGTGTAYWAQDRQAVVGMNGKLYDTYDARSWDWENLDKDSFRHRGDLLLDKIVLLEKVCNLKDVKYLNRWEKNDYENVYDLSYHHGLSKLYAVDKDATPSIKKIIGNKKREIEEKEREISYLQSQAEDLGKQIAELQQIITEE